MANTFVWADIPVADMDRARKFYAAVLQTEVPLMDGANGDVALLPMEPGDMSGDIVKSDMRTPGAPGVTIYLDSKGDPEGMIERAVAAGGPDGRAGDRHGRDGRVHRLLHRQRGQPHRRAQAAEAGLSA